ncbi:MAG TPA: 50S ribosomal protein L6 [Methanomassiliicoccales archaeon]|jgi:large subunit ribosomal protein L6
MTVSGYIEEKIEIPKDVKVTVENGIIALKGKNGQLSRNFSHPKVKLTIADNHVIVSSEMPKVREKAIVGTFAAHVRNMIVGVTIGYEYKMKIVYSHFPIKAAVKGNKFSIENFLGEKAPRSANIIGETKVKVAGAEVLLTGADLEQVSQTAANIERATRIRGFDPRVFQDGIYITEKAGRAI